ncbi:phosphotransferase family protein [Rhodococcus chondri]|uniref:Phosphotransferase family protein n=1 Tax=Rhodococcus chondri TaxID=3065941 RepID=A0ABU7JMJ0_9NOCA|nr:phosphotransferase family protein [Rhodococcus sp. CC-R104]MEE2031253.1 phosphotransferase family protein [Rhodococcus sp. CC-R104]
MRTHQHRGLELPALQRFLLHAGIPLQGDLQAELISGGKSNLTYSIFDDSSRWILRRPPTTGRTPSAHDVAREFRITSALQNTDVPVATPVLLCEDETVLGAPFTVVEHVSGRVLRTGPDIEALSDTQIDACMTELIRVIGALHNVEYQAVGLGSLGRPEGYVARQIDLWAKQWDRVKTRDSADVTKLYDALLELVPAHTDASIVHGDYRVDNTIVASEDVGTVAAVVDWELSTLGDPLTDVALMCVYRHPAFDLVLGEPGAWTSPRLPSVDDLAERYASASGRDLGNWSFYMALAYFKVAVIAEGINHRYRLGATVGAGFDRAGDSVPEFLAAGLHSLTNPRS